MVIKLESYSLASDVLERQFGPCTLKVLQQNESTRFISVQNSHGDILELARTDFILPSTHEFTDVHNAIMGGKSMGKAFRDADIKFTRDLKLVEHRPLPDQLRKHFSQDGFATVMLLDIYVGTQNIHYAQILEVYSPRVHWRQHTQHRNIGASDQKLADHLLQSFPS